MTFGGRNINGGRKIIDDRVEQALHPLLLECGTAEDWDQFNPAGQSTDSLLQYRSTDRLFFENQISDGIVFVGDGINEISQSLFGLFLEVFGNLGDLVLQPFVGDITWSPDKGFLVYDVDQTGKILLSTDGQKNWECISTQLFAHVVQRVFKIGTGTVHFVNERDTRDLVLGGLAPNRLRLGLDSSNATENSDGTIENSHGSFDFSGEVDVSRGVDDVDPVGNRLEGFKNARFLFLSPETGDGGRRDGNTAFLFLLHPVGHGIAVIDVTDFVDQAGVEEDTFGSGRLARINVGGDTDIAGSLQCVLPLRRIQRRVDRGHVAHGRFGYGSGSRDEKCPGVTLGA